MSDLFAVSERNICNIDCHQNSALYFRCHHCADSLQCFLASFHAFALESVKSVFWLWKYRHKSTPKKELSRITGCLLIWSSSRCICNLTGVSEGSLKLLSIIFTSTGASNLMTFSGGQKHSQQNFESTANLLENTTNTCLVSILQSMEKIFSSYMTYNTTKKWF